MIYPDNFEHKIGFDQIRGILCDSCLCQLGRDEVARMAFSANIDDIRRQLRQTSEMRRIMASAEDFPTQYFFDMRQQLKRLRIEGTHLDESELLALGRSLSTISSLAMFLRRGDDEGTPIYPTLRELTGRITLFPGIANDINAIIDKDGRMRDTASPALARIRSSIARMEGTVSGIVQNIMRRAISDGLVDKDSAPALRDGRLVIPISPAQRRKLRGIVLDESASGKTVFVEPEEAVEANNRLRELENEEKRETIRILTDFAAKIRPHSEQMMQSYSLLAAVDFVRAKALLAERFCATEPAVEAGKAMFWAEAEHPLLKESLRKQGRDIVKQEIELKEEARMLIISGPNAGGKSVCLKTVGLLQYMLQCGLSLPISQRSRCCVFKAMMIDIGDGQSIDDDLSTYSGHLRNMKAMLRRADSHTLLLIDEMGSGTEPQIGGAIAEAVAKKLVEQGAYGIITTHYQNLKHFADATPCVVNGAMLYDRQGMRPLFQLAIGRPGSSFAIEIARQAGLPDNVIAHATAIVGTDYIQSDKYLQDIVRDKRYWEGKRQYIKRREHELEKKITSYEHEIEEIRQQRRDIINKARSEANDMLAESNRRIENAIKDIRRAQAEREETRAIRNELKQFGESLQDSSGDDGSELIEKKMRQIEERRKRRQKRREEKSRQASNQPPQSGNGKSAMAQESGSADKLAAPDSPFRVGDTVRMRGLSATGTIMSLSGGNAIVAFGSMTTKLPTSKIEHIDTTTKPNGSTNTPNGQSPSLKHEQIRPPSNLLTSSTRKTIDEHRDRFSPDLDVRGMRGDEAWAAVTYFIDDAILASMPRVRILHGKGNGILRQLIRQYLSTVPAVSHFADEHVQFGGTGITVVDL